MKDLLKKVWFTSIFFFILGAGLSFGFFYYTALFKTSPDIKLAKRSPQSTVAVLYRLPKNVSKIDFNRLKITKNRLEMYKASPRESQDGYLILEMPSSEKLKNRDLRASYFHNYKMMSINFYDSNMMQSLFKRSAMINIRFDHVRLQGSIFDNILEMRDLSFYGAKLQGSKFINLENTKVSGPLSFRRALLQSADISEFTDEMIKASDFRGAYYTKETKLPFDEETAQKLGMIKIDI